MDARVALTLRLLGGLTTDEIARAFLAPSRPSPSGSSGPNARSPTRGGVRNAARRRVARPPAGCPRSDLPDLQRGICRHRRTDWTRPQLCHEALRLGRILAELAPGEGEVHGLVALMEIQASRLAARVGPDGAPILLADQNRARWDQLLIRRGLAALARADALGGAPGPYALQAAIAACHARARTFGETDWAQIAALYGALAEVAPSPVVEVNRAVAVSMAEGPAAGLEVLDRVANRRCGATTSCRASVATFCRSSGGWPRRGRSSNAPRRSPGTSASGRSSSIGRQHALAAWLPLASRFQVFATACGFASRAKR